jgi:hypothetical protein
MGSSSGMYQFYFMYPTGVNAIPEGVIEKLVENGYRRVGNEYETTDGVYTIAVNAERVLYDGPVDKFGKRILHMIEDGIPGVKIVNAARQPVEIPG